jgi:hypothetical protein
MTGSFPEPCNNTRAVCAANKVGARRNLDEFPSIMLEYQGRRKMTWFIIVILNTWRLDPPTILKQSNRKPWKYERHPQRFLICLQTIAFVSIFLTGSGQYALPIL